jgi:ribose 5-phosphate isomerase B
LEFYANVADRVANAILGHHFDRGILRCGTGIAAKKILEVRTALTHDSFTAERAAKSNDTKIIAFGARAIGPELVKAIVNTWLASQFDPDEASVGNSRAINKLDTKYRSWSGVANCRWTMSRHTDWLPQAIQEATRSNSILEEKQVLTCADSSQ